MPSVGSGAAHGCLRVTAHGLPAGEIGKLLSCSGTLFSPVRHGPWTAAVMQAGARKGPSPGSARTVHTLGYISSLSLRRVGRHQVSEEPVGGSREGSANPAFPVPGHQAHCPLGTSLRLAGSRPARQPAPGRCRHRAKAQGTPARGAPALHPLPDLPGGSPRARVPQPWASASRLGSQEPGRRTRRDRCPAPEGRAAEDGPLAPPTLHSRELAETQKPSSTTVILESESWVSGPRYLRGIILPAFEDLTPETGWRRITLSTPAVVSQRQKMNLVRGTAGLSVLTAGPLCSALGVHQTGSCERARAGWGEGAPPRVHMKYPIVLRPKRMISEGVCR